MHVLVVTAHPDPGSYTHAAVSRLVEGLASVSGTTHEVLNLASSGFDPRFAGADNDLFRGGGEVPDDVVEEQRRVDKADVLVLAFPVYWWSMPAVMKGWIDRVFIQGWAFDDDPGKGTTRRLGRLKGQVVAIAGADRGTYERRGYLDAMNAQIVRGIFAYCGIQPVGLELLHPMDQTGADEGLQQAADIGRRLASAG
ncbi:NAD(P)H-dependent oxidoreductase [Aureimonas ureilytica]|uniref:NAD(P)H-dependent oxidoreductase n=1 Tax=Aureimonas ureilytica TaxID=401562 RepID=UPI003CFA12DD